MWCKISIDLQNIAYYLVKHFNDWSDFNNLRHVDGH